MLTSSGCNLLLCILGGGGAGYENNSGREGCPLRIKIGDGERTLRKLPYIGMPAVSKDTGGNSIDVIGFESITKFQNSGTATIRVNLNRDSVGAAKNFDDMEHFHHRFYLTSNIDTRTNEVNLSIFGDGWISDTNLDPDNRFVNSNNMNIFIEPTNCLLPAWHTSTTVSDSSQVCYDCEYQEWEEGSSTSLSYILTMPEDKAEDGSYLFKTGLFIIDLDCLIYKDDTGVMHGFITVNNKFSGGTNLASSMTDRPN